MHSRRAEFPLTSRGRLAAAIITALVAVTLPLATAPLAAPISQSAVGGYVAALDAVSFKETLKDHVAQSGWTYVSASLSLTRAMGDAATIGTRAASLVEDDVFLYWPEILDPPATFPPAGRLEAGKSVSGELTFLLPAAHGALTIRLELSGAVLSLPLDGTLVAQTSGNSAPGPVAPPPPAGPAPTSGSNTTIATPPSPTGGAQGGGGGGTPSGSPTASGSPVAVAANPLATLSVFAGRSGTDLGRSVADGVYADDPTADAAIVDWYGKNLVTAPPRAAAPAPPPPIPADVGALLARGSAAKASPPPGRVDDPLPLTYLKAVEDFYTITKQPIPRDRIDGVFGIGQPPIASGTPLAPTGGGSNIAAGGNAGTVSSAGGCTLEAIVAARAPVGEFLDAKVAAAGLTISQYALIGIIGQTSGNLAWARNLDALYGTSYWTVRWLQSNARFIAAVASEARVALTPLDQRLAAIMRSSNIRSEDAQAQLAPEYAAQRRQILTLLGTFVKRLREIGCQNQADVAAVATAEWLSVGQERSELIARGPDFWNPYGSNTPDGSTVVSMFSPAAMRLMEPDRVEAFVGPFPPAGGRASGAGPTVAGGGGSGTAGPSFDGRAATKAKTAGTERPPSGTATDTWERTATARNSAPVPPGQSGPPDGKGTWLSAAGIGNWPQVTLGGFWRTGAIEDSTVTLIALGEGDRHFDGIVVDKGGSLSGGTWLDMDREAGASAWRGMVHVALREPKGACPHWIPGAFSYTAGAIVLDGVSVGPETDPMTCMARGEPKPQPLRLERVVATSFTPLIPGKFIHLLGVPAGGSTSAQYKAAVSFACTTTGWPPLSAKVTASGGTVVAGATACSYQLVVDRPGGYDIEVEFADAAGKVIHTDYLHADVPPNSRADLMTRPFALVALIAVVMLAPSAVVAQGLTGGLGGGNNPPPTQPGPNNQPPAPGPVQPTRPPAAIAFPWLADCADGLAGLPPGTREATVAALDRRIALWQQQAAFEAMKPFDHPAQAEEALACFERRLTLATSYLPLNDARRAVRAAAAVAEMKWGARLSEFLAPREPQASTDPWWADADMAFEAIARIEVAIDHARRPTADAERDRLTGAARAAIAELKTTIDSVKANQSVIKPEEHAFWLRALAWRARSAGLALDTLQRKDLLDFADDAYAHLLRGDATTPPRAEDNLAGGLAPFLARLATLRATRGVLDPGAPRDWSKMGLKQTAAEELYLINYMAQSMPDRIDEWQAEQADAKRLDLELRFDIATAGGTPAAEIRRVLDEEWKTFRATQVIEKQSAVQMWNRVFTTERMTAKVRWPRSAGPSR